MPICLQIGMKRGRSQIEQLDQDETGEPRKKLRLGTPTCQWITVYNAHAPMKQRYISDSCICNGLNMFPPCYTRYQRLLRAPAIQCRIWCMEELPCKPTFQQMP